MKKPNDDFTWYLVLCVVALMIALFMFSGVGTIVVGCPAPPH